MKVQFKITNALLARARCDLGRSHSYAYERVGFISAGLSAAGDDVCVLAREYRQLLDHEYLPDPSVGAMMGPDAIRKALQWAMESGSAIFHVHTHGGCGLPNFSSVDLRENARFVLDFFKVAPQSVHGAIVLSVNSAKGQVWFDKDESFEFIQEFVEVGSPIRKWRGI